MYTLSVAGELYAVPMADSVQLAADVYAASGSMPPVGTIVLAHGFAGNRHEGGLFDYLASELAARRFRSIVYDARGCGESDGDYATTGFAQHVADFRTILDEARQQTGEGQRLFAIGFSLGAAVVEAALSEGEQLDGVVDLAPAKSPKHSMWPRYEDMWEQTENGSVVQKPGSNMFLGRPNLEMLRDTDLEAQTIASQVPRLICHGTADSRIDISNSRRLAAALQGLGTFQYSEYEGASHSFKPPEAHWKRLAEEIADWLVTLCSADNMAHHQQQQ